MRIIHLIFALNTGGAETMLVDILNEQVKTQTVSLIIINKEINKVLLKQIDYRVNIILINRKEKSRSPIPVLKLNRFLISLNPDVIHCHQHSAIRMIVNRNNVVLTAHTLEIPTTYFKKYKKVYAISNAVKREIESRSSAISELIYNGVKTDEIKHKLDYNFKTFRIVQVGRLDHLIKGQHILIKALEILVYKKGIKNICIDFIGEGESLPYLKKIVHNTNLENYVNFLGIRDRKFIYSHLRDYDLLIQPSLLEGFGLTITESMAARVPVLVSDVEGPMEIIGNGKYGSFFKKGDIDDCAKHISVIVENYQKFKKKTSIASDLVNRMFSIKLTARNYIDSYI